MIVFDGNILTPLAVLDPLTDPHKSAQRVSVETTTSFGRSSHFKIPLAEASYPPEQWPWRLSKSYPTQRIAWSFSLPTVVSPSCSADLRLASSSGVSVLSLQSESWRSTHLHFSRASGAVVHLATDI